MIIIVVLDDSVVGDSSSSVSRGEDSSLLAPNGKQSESQNLCHVMHGGCGVR